MAIFALEGGEGLLFLASSSFRCMENIWNFVARKLLVAFCDQHSLAGTHLLITPCYLFCCS